MAGYGFASNPPYESTKLNPGYALFDHLVGAGEEGGWDRQTDFLSGLQIDDQFEPCRLLDGQLGRYPSFEDFHNIVGRHHHHLRSVRTVGDETARVDTNAERMQDWEPTVRLDRIGRLLAPL